MKRISKNSIPVDPLLVLILDEFGQPKNNGLKKALLLTKIDYLVQKELNNVDGYFWTYNSATEWKKQFPFWSENTIQQALKDLAEKDGLIVRARLSKVRFDRTLWYRVNEEGLNALIEKARNYVVQNPESSIAKSLRDVFNEDVGTSAQDLMGDQSAEFVRQNRKDRGIDGTSTDQPITKPSSEHTHNENERAIVETVGYLNEKARANYKATTATPTA